MFCPLFRRFKLGRTVGPPALALAAILLALWAEPATAISAPPTVSEHRSCVQAARTAERREGIPPHLLSAISLAETGRWSPRRKASLAWPWTVMAEGKGRYLPSKAAAVAEVRALQARGVSNIDVGCFQVNLHYHPDAFDSLEQAFEPTENAAYAASFLADLERRSGGWKLAVARYHSWDETRGPAYRERVFKLWYGQRDQLAASARDRPAAATADHRRTALEEEQERRMAQRARERAGRAAQLEMIQAQREANRRFLEQQKALQEARMQAAFEARKARVLAEYEEMLRKRGSRQGG